MQEALEKWGKERVLADVVRLVRMTRPLVIASVFIGGPSDGHGNHQVAGLMAKEVFEAAADPKRFPEQIREGLLPWKPLKYYAHVPFSGSPSSKIATTVGIPIGDYDPFFGLSYLQLSREGLGFQKSQNDGGSIPLTGKFSSDYHRFGSNVSATDQESSFFDGIDVSLAGIASLANERDRGFLTEALQNIDNSVAQAVSAFSAAHPEKCAPFLAAGLKETQGLIERVKSSGLGGNEKYNILHELRTKEVQFNDAITKSLGIAMRALVQAEQPVNPMYALFMGDPDTFRLAIPGQSFGVRVTLANQAPEKLNVSSVYLAAPSGKQNWWRIDAANPGPGTIAAGETLNAQFKVTASDSIPYTEPYFRRPNIEQPYYNILDAEYLSRPTAPYPLTAWAELKYSGRYSQIGTGCANVTACKWAWRCLRTPCGSACYLRSVVCSCRDRSPGFQILSANGNRSQQRERPGERLGEASATRGLEQRTAFSAIRNIKRWRGSVDQLSRNSERSDRENIRDHCYGELSKSRLSRRISLNRIPGLAAVFLVRPIYL